jgi:PAS domain S-box-containing protein
MSPFVSQMLPRFAATAVVVVTLSLTGVLGAFARDAALAGERSGVATEADGLARHLSDVIARESAAVETLAAFVETTGGDPGELHRQFPVFAEALMRNGGAIRSVQLAPDSVLEYVHPVEGNEAAVGLDLMADPDRRTLLTPAVTTGETVIQGPVPLVQGGIGVLVRRPVYEVDGSFWGFAAILLDWDTIADTTLLSGSSAGVVAGARLLDTGEVIAGDAAAFTGGPVVRRFEVGATDTVWELAVRPAEGWAATAPYAPVLWLAGALVAAVAGAFTLVVLRGPQALRRERERALEELAWIDARYQATFEHAAVGIVVVDANGRVLSANPAFLDIVGVAGEDALVGTRVNDLVDAEDWPRHRNNIARFNEGATMVASDVRLDVPSGLRWCRIRITIVPGSGRGEPAYVCTVEDVTERRQAKRALIETETRYRELFEAAPIGIQREDHRETAARLREIAATGMTDLAGFLASNHDVFVELLGAVRITDENPVATRLQAHLKRDGASPLSPLDRFTPEAGEAWIETMVAMAEGRPFHEANVCVPAADGSPLHLDVRWHAPTVDGSPDYGNVIVTLSDVTRLRVTERRLADLLESKDRFLASVAHELRTPLTAVVGFANELQIDDALTPAERREFVDLIAFHGTEMAHIIEDLLVWARGDIGEVRVSPQTIDLNTTVHQTLRLLPGVDFPVREPDGTVEAVADPARMRQIVRNLATNAVRYGGDAVEVVVRRQNGSAVVEVSDNGPRLAPEDMGRIFEPYGRADGSVIGPGSIGLGLTVSRTLARLQGGDLVFLRDGSRNVFRVTVPV